MRRRHFIALLPGAAVTAGRSQAQDRPRLPYVGILVLGIANARFINPFRKRLGELGYVDGRNVRIEVHAARGSAERLAELARSLAARPADVIVAEAVQASRAARQATAVVPIVMMHAGDPVGAGLVQSLRRPGGNVTGTTSLNPEIVGKLIELVRELNPQVKRAALLLNPANPSMTLWLRNADAAAARTGLALVRIAAQTERELAAAFTAIEQSGADSLIVLAEPFLGMHRAEIIGFARAHRLIDVYAAPHFARDGGLAAYAPAFEEHWMRGAEFVARILKGAKPSALPVEQSTHLRLTVNLKSAQALGLAVPPSIIARADEVIE